MKSKQPAISDDELKAQWAKITDPVEMLNAIVENSWCLGGDPYYNDLVSALTENAERVSSANDAPRWRHVKRGSTYTEAGRGEVQTSRPIVEGDKLVAYRGEDGRWWFRLPEEFDDGRFVKLSEGEQR